MDRTYRPLISGWLNRYQLQNNDVEDLTQEVMTVVVKEITTFEHNGRLGAFRRWLRITAVNIARNFIRKKNFARPTGSTEFLQMLGQLEDDQSAASREFDRAHNQQLVWRMLREVEKKVAPSTMQVFLTHVLEGKSVVETAEIHGVNRAAVHTCKSRILRHLRTLVAEQEFINF